MGKYKVLGNFFDRIFRNDLNANFNDVDADIQAQKKRVDDLIVANPQPAEVQDARMGFPVLRDKLANVDAQLAERATKEELNVKNDYFWTSQLETITAPHTMIPEEMYAIVEGMSHPYVTMGSIGKDQSGAYNVRFWTYEPKNYEKTIFITGGIHGGETYGPYFIVQLFKMLMDKTVRVPPQFHLIKEKVRILAMPIVNPWGMYQSPKTRYNSRGVDINRNFDWNWAKQPADIPFGMNYKGDSPFSEKESQYVKEVLDNYLIDIFMDLHDHVHADGTADYAMYADERTERVLRELIAYLTRNIENPTGIFATTKANASSNNYASAVLEIPSVNIEGLPGLNFPRGTVQDVNENMGIFGNALKLLAGYFNPVGSDFFIKQIRRSYNDGVMVLTNNQLKDITDSVYSFTPKYDGFVNLNGWAIAKQTSANDFFAGRILVEQPGYIKESLSAANVYTTGANPVIPLTTAVPVKAGLPVNIKIVLTNEGSGTCNVKRFNLVIEYNSGRNLSKTDELDDYYFE